MSTPAFTGFSIATQHGDLHKHGHGYQFNGTSQFAPLVGSWGNCHELTIEACINTRGAGRDFQAIVSSPNLSFVHFQIFSAGNITVYTDTGPVILPVIPDTPANIWRHVVIIARSGDSKVIVDGQQLGETNLSLFNYITGSDQVTIGRGYGNGRFFNGSVAGLKIWQDARPYEDIHNEIFNYFSEKPALEVAPRHTVFGLRSFHGKYLSAQGDGRMEANRDWLRGWEKFEIVEAGNGKIGLRSVWHGKFLSAQPDGKLEINRDWLREWEQFEMVITGPNQVGFRSYFGKYLSAHPDGSLQADKDWLRGWEKFINVKG